MALSCLKLGEYAKAEESLPEAGFEIPVTISHASLSSRIRANRPWNMSPKLGRIVPKRYLMWCFVPFWLQLVLLWSAPSEAGEESVAGSVLGQLKTALAVQDAFMEWSMDAVPEHLQPKLPANAHALLTALVAALSSPDNVPVLDTIPKWRNTEPQPLD